MRPAIAPLPATFPGVALGNGQLDGLKRERVACIGRVLFTFVIRVKVPAS